MQHLFTTLGERALAAVISRRPLLAFDFDGTLAPIVVRPQRARLSVAVAERLALLSRQLPLAIVSGRTRDDVLARLDFEPRYVIGSHGAEDPIDRAGASARAEMLNPLREVLQARRPKFDAAGVLIEDKGQSLALHYRLSRNREAARLLISESLESSKAFCRIFPGKMVVNVVPMGAPDKADAVQRLLARCGAACALFAGDDVNDEPVFSSAPADWLTVRIGRDMASRAQFFLESPNEMAMLLDRILALLDIERGDTQPVRPAL